MDKVRNQTHQDNNNSPTIKNSPPQYLHHSNQTGGDLSSTSAVLRSSIGMIPLKVVRNRSKSSETNPNEYIAAMINSAASASADSTSPVAASNQQNNNNNNIINSYLSWPSGISPPRRQCKIWGLENYDQIVAGVLPAMNDDSTSPSPKNNNTNNNSSSSSPKLKSWTAEPLVRNALKIVSAKEESEKKEEIVRERDKNRSTIGMTTNTTNTSNAEENNKKDVPAKKEDSSTTTSTKPKIVVEDTVDQNNNNKNDYYQTPSKKLETSTVPNTSSPSSESKKEMQDKNTVVVEKETKKPDAAALLKKIENLVPESEKEKLLQKQKEAEQELLSADREQGKQQQEQKSNNSKVSITATIPTSTTPTTMTNKIDSSSNQNQNPPPKPEESKPEVELKHQENTATTTNLDPEKQKFIDQILQIHNNFRKKHFAVSLQYDPNCEASAQKCADRCSEIGKMEHSFFDAASTTNGQRQGQNIYWHSGRAKPDNAIETWYNELTNPGYNFEEGKASKPGGMVGHATQLLWRSSTKVGAAVSKCGKFLVCNYYPAGNVTGKYKENVKEKKS